MVTPSVPPYAQLNQEAVQCIAQASVRYDVPELLLHSLIRKEGARPGAVVRNKNGSVDLGVGQINSSWLPELGQFGITAHRLAHDTCLNVYVQAYVVRKQFNRKGDWVKAIISYNIGPYGWTSPRYEIGLAYARSVITYWHELQAWVDRYGPAAQAKPMTLRSLPGPQAYAPPGQQLGAPAAAAASE